MSFSNYGIFKNCSDVSNKMPHWCCAVEQKGEYVIHGRLRQWLSVVKGGRVFKHICDKFRAACVDGLCVVGEEYSGKIGG